MGHSTFPPGIQRVPFSLLGQVKAVVNPAGDRSSFAYDHNNRRIRFRTTFSYDAAGQRAEVRNALGNRTTMAYDAAGQQTLEIDPLGNRTTFGYDAAGQRSFRFDGRGARITYVYDAAGRETGRRFTGGTRLTQTFDSVGRRTGSWNSTTRMTYTYDAAGQLRSVANPDGKRLTYSYDAVGLRRQVFDPDGGRFTYSYDDAGRVTSLCNPWEERTTWSYDAASRPIEKQLANGARATFIYDAAGQPTRLVNLKSNNDVISSFGYAYDLAGNRTQAVEADGAVTTWSYDATQQLTRERRVGANSYDTTHVYDAVGNRTSRIAGGTTANYTFNAANELTANPAAGLGYEYDAVGNTKTIIFISTPLIEMEWDDENRLTRHVFAPPNGFVITHLYDGDGRRVGYQQGGLLADPVTKKFLWDEENVLLETNENDETQVVYTLEPALYGNLISQHRGEASSWYLFDALGSTDRLLDASEAVLNRYLYDAFGNRVLASESAVNPYQFIARQGYYLDGFTSNNAPYYVRARFYAPAIIRWMSRDPIGFAAGDGNLYRYVWNWPLNAIDPSGMFCAPPDCSKICADQRVCEYALAMGLMSRGRGTVVASNICSPNGVCRCICISPNPRFNYKFGDCPDLERCLIDHEIGHGPHVLCNRNNDKPHIPVGTEDTIRQRDEYHIKRKPIDLACYERALRIPGISPKCRDYLRFLIRTTLDMGYR